jgi:hypothetical protein
MESNDVVKRDLLAEFCRSVFFQIASATRSKLHFCNLASITLGMLREMCQIMVCWDFACLPFGLSFRPWGRFWLNSRWGRRLLIAIRSSRGGGLSLATSFRCNWHA